MSRFTTRTTCRSCQSLRLTNLFSLGTQCVSDFLLPEEVGQKEIRCPIEVVLCEECSLVQQRHTAEQEFLYSRHYWYRSGTTGTMRYALLDAAKDATDRVGLKAGDLVIDIGSNDGTLLRAFPKYCVTVGVEPASNLAEEGRKGISTFIPGFWPQDVGAMYDGKAKVVTAFGMAYDLEDPLSFFQGVARVLHEDGLFVLQLMCLKQTVQMMDVGNFAHEHLEFYSLRSLEHIFNRCGLMMVDIAENDVNGGSYRIYVRHRATAIRLLNERSEETTSGVIRIQTAFDVEKYMDLRDPRRYKEMLRRMKQNRDECTNYLLTQSILGKQIWVYGASTKGNVIAQWYGLSPLTGIVAAVDKSPEKVGRRMAGSNIPILSEGIMREERPDICVVLPYAFLQEFLEREVDEEWRKRGGKFVVPLPQFEVL